MVVPITTAVPETGVRITSPYSAALALAAFSLISIVLIFPAIFQHYHNRNVGATVLVASGILANVMVTTNALIWSNDDVSNWYRGVGLCDVQVKLIVLLAHSSPASLFCILRALANVMDTSRTTWSQTASQRRRGYVVDLVCCVGIPILVMALSYINQYSRYAIVGIAGCFFHKDTSWLSLVINILPPLLWSLLGAYYAVLILVRLIRYRRSFSTVLANSNTSKSRFLRLYAMCVLVVLGQLPVSIYVLIANIRLGLHPFSWNATHHHTQPPWNSAILIPSYGAVYYDRIVWILGNYIVFFFFGFGKDAMRTYRDLLLALGFGRLFPALRPDHRHHQQQQQQRTGSVTDTISSFGSKAKVYLLQRRGSTFTSRSTTSTLTDASSSSPSPKKTTFLESINSSPAQHQHLPTLISQSPSPESSSTTTTNNNTNNTFLAPLTSIFKTKKNPQNQPNDNKSRNNTTTTHTPNPNSLTTTTVSTSPNQKSSPLHHTREQSSRRHDVVVMREIRQASETAEEGTFFPLPLPSSFPSSSFVKMDV